MNSFRTCLFSFVTVFGLTLIAQAKEKVVIVTGIGSDQIEELAAKEIATQFEKLFNVETELTQKLPADAQYAVLVGSPKTNRAISSRGWPILSKQGHLVRSLKQEDAQIVVVGGGSPVATLWAAYELGYQYGIRYLMQKDVYPKTPIKLDLSGHDVLLEPTLTRRNFQFTTGSPFTFESWGTGDLEKLIKQLAKLKYNHIELKGASNSVLALNDVVSDPAKTSFWHGEVYEVQPDHPGSIVFKGKKVFENPDFAGVKNEGAKIAATKLFKEKLSRFGWVYDMSFQFTESAQEQPPFVFDLSERHIAPLSQSHTRLIASELAQLPKGAKSNLTTRFQIPAEQDATLHFLSRVAFDPSVTPRSAHDEFFNTITLNQSSTDRLWLAFGHLEAASEILDKNAPDFAKPGPDMLMKHFSTEPLPEWWEEMKEHYTQNMIEMYRSNDQIKTSGREETYYYAKRSEFNVEYLGAIEALRAAAKAKKEGDLDTAIEQMEVALESLYNSIDTLSDIARNPSDRGLIAVLNKYAFGPLNEAYEKMLEEE